MGLPIAEFVGLRLKMCLMLKASGEEIKKVMGVQRVVVKKDLCHELYKHALVITYK